MDVNKIINAGVNYSEGLKRFSNKEELYQKFINKFFEDSSLTDLDCCIQKEQYDEAFKYAHALKGISGNLSLTNIYSCSCKLVEALRSNQIDKVPELYENLLNSCQILRSAVFPELQ